MNRHLSLLLTLFLASLLAGPLQAQSLPTDGLDGIVAVVEEDVILRSELDQAEQNVRRQFADRADQLPPENVLRRQVLERLIMMKLQLQRAESAGVRISDIELEQAISRIAQQNQMTVERLRNQIAAEGLNYDEFRQQLREELTAQRLRQSYVQSRVAVSETEIDIHLASQSLQRGEVRLGLILVAIPDGATADQLATARTKIDGVKSLIERGEMDFNAAAIRYSDHQSALEGGDLGWRGYDQIPPAFVPMVQGTSPGELAGPVRGPSGYTLLKVLDTREEQRQSITEYHARGIMVRITEVVDADKAQQKIEQLHARLERGDDFAEIARAESDDVSTRSAGGDMGWFPAMAWGTAVGEVLLSLKDNELSRPFRTEAGWHVLQRLGSREQDVTEQSRRNAARESIARRKSEEEFERFLRQMRDEAYIDNRLPS